jgi:hypothetical protein
LVVVHRKCDWLPRWGRLETDEYGWIRDLVDIGHDDNVRRTGFVKALENRATLCKLAFPGRSRGEVSDDMY